MILWRFLTEEVLWSTVVWGALAAFFKAWKEWRGDLPDFIKVGLSVVFPLGITYLAYHAGVWAGFYPYDHTQEVDSMIMALKGIVGSKGIFAVTRGIEEMKGLKAKSGSTRKGKG